MTRILIIGGYGVFGGLLAKRLLTEKIGEVLIAGRTQSKAAQFCSDFGGTPVEIDRDNADSLRAVLVEQEADIVVDAAGPFDYHAAGYHVAKAAIEAGVHYLDLADDADFVNHIGELNSIAMVNNVSVLSGVSSVPAISTAALDALTYDLSSVESINMAILPGNRAPRGLAVIQSILGQAGKPFKVWRDDAWHDQICWGDLVSCDLEIDGHAPIKNRWSSAIRVPDTDLIAQRYGAMTVEFRAGLELKLLHGGLWLMAWLPRLGLIKSLRPFARLVQIMAGWVEHVGSDRGGMFVEIVGKDASGNIINKRWTLIAEEGAGPNVPATPAYVMIKKLIAGDVPPGARPAMGEFSLDEIEEALSAFAIYCETAMTK